MLLSTQTRIMEVRGYGCSGSVKRWRKPSQSRPSRSPPLAEGEYSAETELRKIQVLIWMSCSFVIGVYLLE